jgi:uncharacterized protein DUF222/HNH endonuclease
VDEVLERIRTAIADLQARSPWAASIEESAALLTAAQIAVVQLTALQASHARELHARDYPAKQGATSLAVWLRDSLRISIFAARRLVKLGDQIDARPAVADAVAVGVVNSEQTAVIAAALADLPDDTAAAIRDECESALVAQAQTLEPGLLRTVGERILAHVAPQVAEEALLAKLERDERNARETQAFTMIPRGNGIVRLAGSLDAESAAVIRAAIDPLSRPVPGADGGRDTRLPARRRAEALVEVCALALATGELPDHGGIRPQLTAVFDLDPIAGIVHNGTLDTGESLSPAAVRRFACDAGIIPAALGSRSEILDLGRARRLYSGSIRLALILRDGGCAFPGCDRPPQWTEGHHIRSWLDGGETNLANGVLLCRRHHRAVHHDGWTVRIATDQRPEFIPPPYVDPCQRPQRNRYHLRN